MQNTLKCSEQAPRKVGYAYVPIQKLNRLYSPDKALMRGTIFPELDLTIDEYERGLYNGK